ncbi:MAG: hypothetical protein ACRD0U_17275, partial [Acidimicrobiales bacterium]
ISSSFAHEHQSYVRQGEYAIALRSWLERFPLPQTLVLFSADLFGGPQRSYDQVCDFLAIPRHTLCGTDAWNPTEQSSMTIETRERLRAHYQTHDAALAQMLFASLPWPS